MKVKAFQVSFTREVDFVVIAPENATQAEVQAAAKEELRTLHNWSLPDWNFSVYGEQIQDIPITEYKNQAGFRQVRTPYDEPLALGKSGTLVDPADADWLRNLPLEDK
jgi:hypothetical protein